MRLDVKGCIVIQRVHKILGSSRLPEIYTGRVWALQKYLKVFHNICLVHKGN